MPQTLLHVSSISITGRPFVFQATQDITLLGLMGHLGEDHDRQRTEIRQRQLNLQTDGKTENESELFLRQELESASKSMFLFLLS